MRKRVTTLTQANNCYSQKQKKIQIVNYGKFSPVPNNKGQFDSSLGQQWGRMELIETLGSGANATVKQGKCHEMFFAVKVYEKYKLIEPKKKKRVYSQINLLRSLPGHQNIISFYQAFENKNQIHMVLQHMENSITLHQHFRNNMLFLQKSERDHILLQIAKGVAHLHREGVAHRDLKPDNILIASTHDSSAPTLKLIDFGYATREQVSSLQCGTPNFMSPELLAKREYNPKKSDVWALGVLFFYLSEGRYPFRGYDERDLARTVQKGLFEFKKIRETELMDLIQWMLDVHPDNRPTLKEIINSQFMRSL